MKFCKKYQEYMVGKGYKLPGVGCQKLEKILKNCRITLPSQKELRHVDRAPDIQPCVHQCSVCDGSFFPSLVNDMTGVASYFNERAKKLLKLHQGAGFRKYFNWFQAKLRGSDDDSLLIQEGKELVFYALINAIAIQKLLKKYDKVHNCCKQGPAFKSQAQIMQIEILQSPWLRELMAFNINWRETNVSSSSALEIGSSETYHLRFNDEKPSLSCELFDTFKLDIDLTCPVCLETVFDPVSLTCGHILCQMCACSAASVSIVDGLKSAESNEKCPLCRQAGVYRGAVDLTELSILLSRSCPDYREKRLKMERAERVRQAKEYWEFQCRAFTGT